MRKTSVLFNTHLTRSGRWSLQIMEKVESHSIIHCMHRYVYEAERAGDGVIKMKTIVEINFLKIQSPIQMNVTSCSFWETKRLLRIFYGLCGDLRRAVTLFWIFHFVTMNIKLELSNESNIFAESADCINEPIVLREEVKFTFTSTHQQTDKQTNRQSRQTETIDSHQLEIPNGSRFS